MQRVGSLMDEDAVSKIVIGAAIEVHRDLGPGLLESAYQRAMPHELSLRNLEVASELRLAVVYKGIDLGDCYRIDLLVADSVIVEIKAVAHLAPIHNVQLLTYLRFANKRLELLLNFQTDRMKNGIRRVVNGLVSSKDQGDNGDLSLRHFAPFAALR